LTLFKSLFFSVISLCLQVPWTSRTAGPVCVCLQLSGMFSDLPKVLILGAIAAASAFVVTILIVLVCVGCQRWVNAHTHCKHLLPIENQSFIIFHIVKGSWTALFYCFIRVHL